MYVNAPFERSFCGFKHVPSSTNGCFPCLHSKCVCRIGLYSCTANATRRWQRGSIDSNFVRKYLASLLVNRVLFQLLFKVRLCFGCEIGTANNPRGQIFNENRKCRCFRNTWPRLRVNGLFLLK